MSFPTYSTQSVPPLAALSTRALQMVHLGLLQTPVPYAGRLYAAATHTHGASNHRVFYERFWCHPSPPKAAFV
jgi:hypothetical protein